MTFQIKSKKPQGAKKRFVGAHVSPVLYETLLRLARKNGLSLSQLLLQMIEHCLYERDKK